MQAVKFESVLDSSLYLLTIILLSKYPSRSKGSDIPAGSTVLRHKDCITPSLVGVLATVGKRKISVYKYVLRVLNFQSIDFDCSLGARPSESYQLAMKYKVIERN